MKKFLLSITIIGVAFLIGSCSPTPAPAEREWNYLIYMAADNNLETAAIDDMNELERIGSSDRVNVLVLFDRAPGYNSSNGDWTTTRLYRVTKDRDLKTINSTLLKDYGELNMADPVTLTNFLNYAETHYPAKRTLLTLWNHGSGIYPRSATPDGSPAPVTRGIAEDITTDFNKNVLYTDEIALALKPFVEKKKIEILNTDACLMQMFEVAWELMDSAHYLVGAQTLIPNAGNNYTHLLRYLVQNPARSTKAVASFITTSFYSEYVDSRYPFSYSSVDLQILQEEVVPPFKRVVAALADFSSRDLGMIAKVRKEKASLINSKYFWAGGYIDMTDFLRDLSKESLPSQLKRDVAETLNGLERATIVHRATEAFGNQGSAGGRDNRLYGLTINFPILYMEFMHYDGRGGYEELQIAQESEWFYLIDRIFFEEYAE